MKTKLSLIVVLCFVLPPAVTYAQPPELTPQELRIVQQRIMATAANTLILSHWDGLRVDDILFLLQRNPDVRAAWGVSDEQLQQLRDVQSQGQREFFMSPEYQQIRREIQGLLSPADPWRINIDAETRKKLQTLEVSVRLLSLKAAVDAIDKILMPELKQKMNEVFWASMAAMPIIAPNMFEALGLTDGQKQQMRRIKEEFEPEFRRIVETFINDQLILVNKVRDELEKQGYGEDVNNMPEDRGEAIQKKLMAEDPEYKRIYEEGRMLGQSFTTRFRLALFDVLTDEQWVQLQNLIDEPPAHAKMAREWMVNWRRTPPAWRVGFGSWRVDEAFLNEYRQARNAR